MAKKNDDFFLEKKAWTMVKDELLGCYFKPYVSKILHTNRPLVYADCFAGKGKFADGNNGSPLIALETIDQCCASTSVQRPRIEATFIDLNYADDLRKNLSAYPWVKIVSRKYEDNIWYDEYEIKPGMSIRESVDRGLVSCDVSVLIFSKWYFQKKWTILELNGLIQRMLDGFAVPSSSIPLYFNYTIGLEF